MAIKIRGSKVVEQMQVKSKKAYKNGKPKSKVRLADMSLLFVAFLWGAGFIAVEYSFRSGMPASLLVAIRFSVAAFVVFAVKFKTIIRMKRKELINGMVAGSLLFFSFLMQTIGQEFTGVSNSAFITTVYVVIVPFIIWAVKRKPPRLKMFILVFTTLIGVIILTYEQGTNLFAFSTGDIYLLFCAVGFAAHIVFLGVKIKELNTIRITFMQLIVCAVLGTATFFIFEDVGALTIDWKMGLPAILYLGVFSTAVCYFLQTWAQKITTASKAAIIMSAESLFGPLFSMAMGLEMFRVNIVVGGAIILGSVILSEIDFKKPKSLKA